MHTNQLLAIGQSWYDSLKQSVADPVLRPVPLVIATAASSFGAWLFWKKWYNRNRKLPPSPRGWPLFGNMLDLSEHLHMDCITLQKQSNLPDIFTLRLGPSMKMIILNSHSAIKDAFVTQGDMFSERPPITFVAIMGIKDEIISKSFVDPTWNAGKQMIMSALRSSGVGGHKGAEEKILDQVDLFVEIMEANVKNNEPIDMSDIMKKTATNVIFGLLFNKVYELEDPELIHRMQVIEDWYASLVSANNLELMSPRIANLFFRGRLRRFRKLTEDCREFVRQEIEEHMDTLDPEHPRDFIDIYLTRNEDTLDIDTLTDTIFIFLPDAMDSVGISISWVIMYVTKHPDVMRKLQKEADDVTSGNRHITWSDRPQLPYTEATIMEAIRVACPVSETAFHAAIRDCYYRGYFIPAGVPIVGNIYSAMRDPINFKDPELFRPERFLDVDGSLVKTDSWIPFGMGRRKCLGEQTSKIELFLFIANLFQRYDFTFSDDNPDPSLEPAHDVFVRQPQPYKVVLKQRN